MVVIRLQILMLMKQLVALATGPEVWVVTCIQLLIGLETEHLVELTIQTQFGVLTVSEVWTV